MNVAMTISAKVHTEQMRKRIEAAVPELPLDPVLLQVQSPYNRRFLRFAAE